MKKNYTYKTKADCKAYCDTIGCGVFNFFS